MLTITVTGTNDGPIANPPGGTPGTDPGIYDDTDTIAEDDIVPASGNVLANDVDIDTSDVLVVSAIEGLSISSGGQTNAVGSFGTLRQHHDGNYEYFLNNGNTSVQSLAVGETLTETFSYTANDQNGGTATATLTITITGTNDVPAVNPGVGPGLYDDTNSITEDSFPNTTDGNVLSNDSDPDGDDLTVAAVNGVATNVGSQITGSYGAVTINVDGSYDYVLDNSNPTVTTLDETQTLTDTFTYTADDGNGGTATATLTITINGADDATVINPDNVETDEDSSVVIDVLANDSDPDDTLTVASVDDSGLPGDAFVTNNGTDVTFVPGTAFNDLAVGETEIVTFTYTTNTGATETVTVTVTGTNDGPVAANDVDTVVEDLTINVTAANGVIQGPGTDTDADTSDVLKVIVVENSSSVRSLVGSPIVGTYGTLTLNEDGSYSYSADQDAADQLSAGQIATDVFTYTISDGNGGTDTATLTITVTGTNDAPVAVNDSGAVDQGATLIVSAADGVVETNDSDVEGDSLLVTNDRTEVGTYGTLILMADGSYQYSADQPAAAALDTGETATDSFSYTISDGNGGTDTATLTITVTGTNAGPVAVDDTATTDEDSALLNIPLLANDSDPNGDDLTITQINGITAGGTITLPSGALITVNGDGTVNYDPNGSFESLDETQTATDTFTYVVSDGNGETASATATVTINGVDDPTITNPDAVTTDEDDPIVIDVLNNDADPDDALSVASVTQPVNGNDGVVVNNGTNVTFTPGSNFDSLDVGESATTTFSYTTNTGATEVVTVTILGQNDAPTVTNTTMSGTVYESGLPSGTGTAPTTTTVTGNFVANDVDGDNLILRVNGTDLGSLTGNPSAVVGTILGDDGNGRLTVFGDGSYRYDLIDAADHDADDLTFIASEIEQFTVTVFDGTVESAPVSLTVNIVDDEIVIGSPASGSLTNTAGSSFSGDLGVVGADGDSGSVTGAIAGWDGVTTTFADSGLESRGETVYYYVDPNDESVLIAYTDSSGTPGEYDVSNPNQSLVFTLEVDPSNNNYEFELIRPVDNTESLLIDFSSLSAAGPQDNYRFTDGPSLLAPTDAVPPGEIVVFTAYGIDPADKVNSNASYLGINNNLVDPSEAGLVIDLLEEGRQVTIEYLFNGGGSNTMISWTAYATDDTTVLGTGVHDAMGINSGSFSVTNDWDILGKVEISSFDGNTKSFRISTITVDGIDSETPLDVAFPVDITDQDGDSASTSVTISISNPTTPPVVIDLDGDGAEFDSIEDGIEMDVDGDGIKEQTAWADEDDAVLVYDKNDNNQVDDRSEYAFADYGEEGATDLEGLRHFDSNEDLVLDANDDEFESFKLWQDRDGDGEVGDDEMITLTEAGIESIELVSDGESYTTADGDVFVHGEATVHYSDGSTGTAADAAFDFRELADDDDSLEIVASDGNIVDVNAVEEDESVPADSNLLAGAADAADCGACEGDGIEGGAAPMTSIEDDIAANDATMG